MSIYKTTHEYVLYTVLDNKLLNKLAKAYKKQVDKLFNEEEQIQVRKMKIKIGKEFLVEEGDDIPETFNIDDYIKRNMSILKERGLKAFLSLHGWTESRLADYFTKVSNLRIPITKITFI